MTVSRRVLILFGTETGNAQDYAEMTAKKCQRLRFEPMVLAMDQCTIENLVAHSIVVVICSTTGQGELPRNALKLWKQLLRKKLPNTLLQHVQFTTFGLGDSSYPRYNWAIRKIHKRLVQLGGQEFAMRGEGDEQNSEGPEAHFDKWLNDMSSSLMKLQPLPDGQTPIDESELLTPRFQIKSIGQPVISKQEMDVALTRPWVSRGVVASNDRITAHDHFQDVRHLVFDIDRGDHGHDHDHDSATYVPGDTVALYPSNNTDEVDLLIKHQQWEDIAHKEIEVNGEFEQNVPGGLVSPLTLRNLLIHHLDISAIPRRSFFATAWHFASDERERERLQEFSTLEGLEDLFDYANRPRRSVLETILEFDSLKIPVDHILDVLPVLRPRLFSIASPMQSSHFELAIAIVKYKTIIRRIRRGVCTRWVEKLHQGNVIPFTLHKQPLPQNLDKPIVMISPGTGVAPMRSLIHTRLSLTDQSMVLFFGCRYKDKDFIFKDEWARLLNSTDAGSGSLELVCAFSRDENGGGYVQNKLYENRQRIGELITKENATVYIGGSSGAMPRQVRITLVEVVKQAFNCDDSAAEDYVRQMEIQGRYLQETW